jgi:hypothetical protein
VKRFEVPWGLREVFLILVAVFILTEGFTFIYEGTDLHERSACRNQAHGVDTCQLLAVQGAFSILLVASTYLTVRRNRRSMNAIGLGLPGLRRNVYLGLTAGVLLLVIGQTMDYISSALWGTSPLQEMLLEGARDPGVLPALLVVGSVFAPISEEIYFRGFAYPAFRKRAGIRGGIILCSLFFAAAHLDPRAFLSLVVVSVGLTYLYEYSGSIVPSVVAHFLINTSSFVMAFLGVL